MTVKIIFIVNDVTWPCTVTSANYRGKRSAESCSQQVHVCVLLNRLLRKPPFCLAASCSPSVERTKTSEHAALTGVVVQKCQSNPSKPASKPHAQTIVASAQYNTDVIKLAEPEQRSTHSARLILEELGSSSMRSGKVWIIMGQP